MKIPLQHWSHPSPGLAPLSLTGMLTQKREGCGGNCEEPEALAGPSYDYVEAEAEENGQHGQDCPVLDDEDDLNGKKEC